MYTKSTHTALSPAAVVAGQLDVGNAADRHRAVGCRPRRLLVVSALLLVAVVLSGCGGRRTTPATPDAARAAAPSVTATPVEADDAVGTDGADHTPSATVARASGAIAVHDAPGGAVTRTMPATTGFGTPTVLLVSEIGAGDADGWLQVLLPVRPNGSTGWIRATDVELRDVDVAVEVDLDARRLVVRDGHDELLSTRTAVGRTANPTPTGRFYVVDKLQTPDPDGAYGPYAIGLSARSEVLTEFGGGDGQIGIHGTNAPDSIGRAVSHGCMRVDNEIVEQLAHLLPLGTPVTIV